MRSTSPAWGNRLRLLKRLYCGLTLGSVAQVVQPVHVAAPATVIGRSEVTAEIAEHLVEGAVLHHQHDDVVDLRQRPDRRSRHGAAAAGRFRPRAAGLGVGLLVGQVVQPDRAVVHRRGDRARGPDAPCTGAVPTSVADRRTGPADRLMLVRRRRRYRPCRSGQRRSRSTTTDGDRRSAMARERRRTARTRFAAGTAIGRWRPRSPSSRWPWHSRC